MLRLAVFIIALLLAVGAIDVTNNAWLVTLAVLSGIVLFSGGGFWPRFHRARVWSRDWDW